MTIQDAVNLIRNGIVETEGVWADLGAGTGTFTQALQSILLTGKVFAVDKSPHALWRLPQDERIALEIIEGDFFQTLDLPLLDGIIMANSLHYAAQPAIVLKPVLTSLKKGGRFILVEYETKNARPPWIPYPIPFERFKEIAKLVGLSSPEEIGRISSRYGHDHIYAASCLCSG